jgi:predicted ATPase/DNA-binding CsgD family transcriptional regulator
VPTGELIGREQELDRLTGMLSERGARLVTVTGPAGVGKTRMALAAADAMGADLRGSVLRVELAPLEDPRLVAEAIAVAAGAGSSRGTSALDAAIAALGDQDALLVIDNFEHVEPAAGDVGALLDACRGVTVLVTSRHVLGLSAERMFPLTPLAPDTAAVALFAARARARDPSFELTPEVAAAVAEICRRLDGLPLAIELAAARAAVLSPQAMVARWDESLGLDTEGARDLPSRQRTLRSAFDWSYDLLEPDEQALLRRLATFPDGFDVSAVEAAQRGDGGRLGPLDLDPIATLAALLDRSLLYRDASVPSEPRFFMLTIVRRYLRERLAACGEEEAAERWMAGVCAAAAAREGRQFGGGMSGEQLDRLDRDLNNMRVALDLLLAHAPVEALDLAADLYRLWQSRHVREGRDWVERTLNAAGDDAAPTARARACFYAVCLAHFQADAATQLRLADECFAAAEAADDPLVMARALYIRGMARVDLEPAAAEASYRESLAICERLGDDVGIATASNDLGEIARGRHALDEAQEHYTRALEKWRAMGDKNGVGRGAHNLAHAARDLGDHARAAELMRESLSAATEIDDRNERGAALAGLAVVAAERSPSAGAATLHGAAEAELARAGVVLDPIDDEPFVRAHALLHATLGERRMQEARERGQRLDPRAIDRLVERLFGDHQQDADDVLSRREREVVRCVAEGLTNAEIASRLVLSEHTVHRHVANILAKLGVKSRAAAAVAAAERDLL